MINIESGTWQTPVISSQYDKIKDLGYGGALIGYPDNWTDTAECTMHFSSDDLDLPKIAKRLCKASDLYTTKQQVVLEDYIRAKKIYYYGGTQEFKAVPDVAGFAQKLFDAIKDEIALLITETTNMLHAEYLDCISDKSVAEALSNEYLNLEFDMRTLDIYADPPEPEKQELFYYRVNVREEVTQFNHVEFSSERELTREEILQRMKEYRDPACQYDLDVKSLTVIGYEVQDEEF